MRSAGRIEMVIYARLQPSRAESTADINIETGFEKEAAEFTDVEWLINR